MRAIKSVMAAGRDLRSRYARRKLGRQSAFDGLEVVAFSRGSHIGYFNKSTLTLALESGAGYASTSP